jgi:perosamine synthetase
MQPPKPISFFNTYIAPSAPKRVTDTLRSTILSEGMQVKEFETALTGMLGLVNPIAVNSGTSALHLALVLAGIGPGDEVILPAQTFVASGLVITACGAKPVFADIEYETGNIDAAEIEAKITSRTKAIMTVDWGGLPADLDAIREIARAHGIKVIEDAAHALGATYRGNPIGSIADYTCFSFQAIKHVTTGDGGAVCALDAERAHEARTLRWFGIDRDHAMQTELGERDYDISATGYKYHLNDYSASLGLANLETFSERLAARRMIAKRYRNALAVIPGITLFAAPEERESAYWVFGFHVERRSDFIRTMRERGIPVSVVHRGIDHNSLFGGTDEDLRNQRKFDETQIHIPIHDALDEAQIEYIIQAIQKGW